MVGMAMSPKVGLDDRKYEAGGPSEVKAPSTGNQSGEQKERKRVEQKLDGCGNVARRER